MFENTTVSLPLNDFDELREGHSEYKKIASRIAACFDYTCKRNPDPKECESCGGDVDCPDCEVYKSNPQYDEKFTLDIERLIRVAKQYALWGKDIEADIDEIPIVHKTERVAE